MGQRAGDGYRNGKIRFAVRGGWGTFEIDAAPATDALRGRLGRAGLWKPDSTGRGAKFEIPPCIQERAASEPAGFARIGAWARGTAGGTVDRDWEPPARSEVERWLPDGALTLQVGPVARQGELICDERRLALGFCIVSNIPPRLPAGRRAWLRELLADGQERWRLVRIGLDNGDARAEVDLTGAPAEALEELIPIGVDALRLVVSELVEQADFLVHGAKGCRALEDGPTGQRPKRKRRKKK